MCRGKVADKKLSLFGTEATCGMVHSKSEKSDVEQFSSKCCENLVSVFTTDKEYTPSSFKIKEVESSLQLFTGSLSYIFQVFNLSNDITTSVSPPDISIASMVYLADICIFRL